MFQLSLIVLVIRMNMVKEKVIFFPIFIYLKYKNILFGY